MRGGDGGSGGSGGSAIGSGFPGGDGGRGGDGGTASVSVSASGPGEMDAFVNAAGGHGGVGGDPGLGGSASNDGNGGRGGNGGNASLDPAGVTVTSTSDRSDAVVLLFGGRGGDASALGGTGGDGGSVSVTDSQVVATSPTDSRALLDVNGGDGGRAFGNGASGRGGDAIAINAVKATSDSTGVTSLSQAAYGGFAGSVENGTVGDAGSAFNRLEHTSDSDYLRAILTTEAGVGGDRNSATGVAGAGADATSIGSFVNSGDIGADNEFRSGDGGTGLGGASGGNAGDAFGDLQVQSNTASVDAFVSAIGGEGGSVSGGLGRAGNGGNVESNVIATAETGAFVFSSVEGGTGGFVASGSDASGGDGGTVTGSVHAVTATGTASAEGFFTGGSGSSARANGDGGNGASISIDNLVTATSNSASGDSSVLIVADAGTGGDAQQGTSGIGGDAVARSSAVHADADSAVEIESYGGNGGGRDNVSGLAGRGGNATADVSLTNDGTATGTVGAYAGYGGSGTGGAMGAGGADAIGSSSVISRDSNAQANTYAFGGDGGSTESEPVQGGLGGDSIATAYAQADAVDQVASSYAESVAGYSVSDTNAVVAARSGRANANATSVALQGSASSDAIADGRVASAIATAEGLSGNARAITSTAGATFASETSDVLRIGSNSVSANVGSRTRVDSFSAADGTMWSEAEIDNSNAFSMLTLSPSVSLAQPELAGQANINAAFGDNDPIGIGVFGGNYPSSGTGLHSFTTNIELQFSDLTYSGDEAFIGFYDFTSNGLGFEELMLSISTDSFSNAWSFTDLATASTFFTDNVISLGAISGNQESLLMQLDWSSSRINDGFSASYAITAVPEPSSCLAILVAFVAVNLRRRFKEHGIVVGSCEPTAF
ncbi:hypothetical protein RBWH47_01544 [Rhodopirellula baltica WH47]|uniref:Uncharacterized protein n=1 Tax=Rhodopirellula baltica WH47 TaxID=991778 RepID=F2ASI5_RHOBT|nr:hypothetical protein RBWH47_01544 [Rhodopirellula baltica WH47]